VGSAELTLKSNQRDANSNKPPTLSQPIVQQSYGNEYKNEMSPYSVLDLSQFDAPSKTTNARQY
jgi:hypothetical protein